MFENISMPFLAESKSDDGEVILVTCVKKDLEKTALTGFVVRRMKNFDVSKSIDKLDELGEMGEIIKNSDGFKKFTEMMTSDIGIKHVLEQNSYKIGHFSEDWNADKFKLYNGTVEICLPSVQLINE